MAIRSASPLTFEPEYPVTQVFIVMKILLQFSSDPPRNPKFNNTNVILTLVPA